MRRPIEDSVVVITGASSGIGRAAAELFASRGATVVLAARREHALREVARECEGLGGRALVVPLDVLDKEAVQDLARRAIEEFGRIDVWVNNAAVALFGRFEETPYDVYRRVIETNLFGYIHGARAAIPIFREQGAGVLINNSSMVARIGQPYTSAYVSSKWAIDGLSECLRQELLDAPNIHVCNVLPATIDTPLFRHAANYTGRAATAMPPVYEAERVAEAIVELARSPRRQVFVGNSGRMIAAMHTVAPNMTLRMIAKMVDQDHLEDRPSAPTPGNLFEPMPQHTGVRGGWMYRNREKMQQQAQGLAVFGAVAGLGLAAWWWLGRSHDGKGRLHDGQAVRRMARAARPSRLAEAIR